MAKTLVIEGMSCQHCVKHVTTALKDLEGVNDAKVDLKKGTAVVELSKDIADQVFVDAVDDAGYKVVKIEG